ncbi:MAG: DUF3298 domain-containing protein [Muribaculaceae bacterium]|nr:DUF3298 domain-containing protein [Muribaculaceae bacterium]MBR6431512.1 DUF3298 domain-containing protein [Muribaculaceae bacterium]
MKTKFFFAFLLLALSVQAAPKIKTQHFECKDSIRFFDKEEPDAQGYKFTKSVNVDWPVTINGKKSKALNDFLVEEVFYASHNPESFPTIPQDVNSLTSCVKNWVSNILRSNTMVQEYIVKEYGTPGVTDIKSSDDYMSCWYETLDFEYSHSVGNLVFFVERGDYYYGGAHDVFGANYLAFDATLDKPIRVTDIVTNLSKVLKMLPSYDHRDKESKWWDNINEVDIDNFYIKNGKMVFVFQPYAVGPFCDGIVEVPVPLKTLKAKKLLTAYGKKLLK